MMDADAGGRDGARPPGDAAGPDSSPSPDTRERTDSPGADARLPDARADGNVGTLAEASGCSCAVGGPSESIWGGLLCLLALRRARHRLVVRRAPS